MSGADDQRAAEASGQTLALLPDIPGKAHGIVQWTPFVRIQCDGCGFIHDGQPGKPALAVQSCGIEFSPQLYRRPEERDRRRLCRDCRRREWGDQE